MTDLVVIEKHDALRIFTEPGALDPILNQIQIETLRIAPDISTAKGRKEIASVAYRVAQAKTYIDGIGKDLVAEMKEIPKRVDASRKTARDFLDELKDKIRQPLDAWEAEQARIEAEKKAAEEAAELAKQVEHDHEMALLMNTEFDRQQEAAQAAAEQARAEREQQIAREAAERAQREAELKAQAEREAAQRAIVEAEVKAKIARAEAEAAMAKAKADAAAAAERAEREKQQAIEDERRRAAAEVERKRLEDAARAADQENRRTKNLEALADMQEFACLDEDAAKAVLIAIAKRQIRNVQINY